ncbi:MAG: helix-turn-helix domain-containing protein [Clostridia bacterium]|nr:helix-turn-helix domain-containing protein [Clostridia bacterium]
MQNIRSIQIHEESNEELLPGFSQDFPYIASCAELDKYIEPAIPWHWHRTVELFYMESGTLEYTTPNGKWTFPAGSGGFVNSNVLHTSRVVPSGEETIQLLHLFDSELLAGIPTSRVDAKYIRPLTSATGIEMIALSNDVPQQAALLEKIRKAFDLDEGSWGYEFTLRHYLTEIWLELFELVRGDLEANSRINPSDEKMKAMMRFIHSHYQESISVEDIAREAHISKRVCFRLFQENLHMTPLEYMTSYRLRKACQRLVDTNESITQIAYNCGLGSSSYFGKVFRERYGCTPAAYRKSWHDCDKYKHK